jgi:hypothetical protein
VTLEEATDLATRLKLSAVFETSAKDASFISDVFYRCFVDIVDSTACGSNAQSVYSYRKQSSYVAEQRSRADSL